MENPIEVFSVWFEEAKQHPSIPDPTVMTLATASKDGKPSARIILLKGFDENGFVFYTNLESRKSQELRENPHAALCFHWQPLGRQVRIEGVVRQVTDEEADSYFNTRPLISRIGALVSRQSQPLDARATLMQQVEAMQARYSETHPPVRPVIWSGWRVVPERIEFWQEGDFRLHDRDLFTRDGTHWVVSKLYP